MNPETNVLLHVAMALLPCYAILIRLMMILPALRTRRVKGPDRKLSDEVQGSQKHIMIFLGSGGHTGEMLRILEKIDIGGAKATWIASSGDSSSLEKAKAFEEKSTRQKSNTARYLTVPRARKVGEPAFLAIKSTLSSFGATASALYREPKPDVLLVNGPGTSVPIAYVLFAFKFLGICRTRIIYIESLARVHLLSLSGRLIAPTADRILVQWPQVRLSCHRAEYYGILV